MIRAAKAATCLAIAACASIGVCFAPSVLMQQAEAKASVSAVKWLKGSWYTAGGSASAPGKPRAMVRFTQAYVKYYGYSTGSWELYQKAKIVKSKKTKNGYTVYLKDGTRYEAGDRKTLHCKWGKDGYSGSSSLWRK